MLHLLYIVVFAILAVLAVVNLVRNLVTLSVDAQRHYAPRSTSSGMTGMYPSRLVPHPELLDDTGNLINEPLLVMRSIDIEDARQQLDSLYNSSPSRTEDSQEEG
ncbi:DUF2973 domain-containing protein [Merismopedia glauca]|uniref:DUF2973 domain-containing protein n=2 Tax=Merismopedia TaxID=53402 RepID=A0A2T1C368_9CYAN|nr:DUF2973 domain-containing protein [Merismopedia glauca CCAP 1448/3]